MTQSLVRRALLLVAFGATLPLPLIVGAQLLAGSAGLLGGDVSFLLSLGILMVVNAAVGVAIVWRSPGNRVGILMVVGALMLTSVVTAWPWLIAVGPQAAGPVSTFVAWWSPIGVLPSVFVLFPTVVLVFPDGHLPSARWRWPYAVAAMTLIVGLLLQAIAPWPIDPEEGLFGNPFAIPGVSPDLRAIGDALAIFSVLVAFALALVSMGVRFRRAGGVERAQVKWLLAAVALNCVLFPLSYVTEIQPDGLLDVASVVAAALIPLSIGIAVLRYRLYEIDRIISRTVSWALVTACVLAVFALLVVGLQAALESFTQRETVAVALSTIVAAALFQPVRRRVQERVDRRFDRAHYDGERTIATFAHDVRDEVDLPHLRDSLVATAHEAVRPAAAGLWLRNDSRTPAP